MTTLCKEYANKLPKKIEKKLEIKFVKTMKYSVAFTESVSEIIFKNNHVQVVLSTGYYVKKFEMSNLFLPNDESLQVCGICGPTKTQHGVAAGNHCQY